MPAMNRSMSVPDTGPMWDMPTSVSQQSGTTSCFVIATLFCEVLLLHQWFFCFVGGETSLWDLTMSNSAQGPTLEHLQKVCNLCNLESAFTPAKVLFYITRTICIHSVYLKTSKL